jgi:hypothetical protein
VTHYRGSYDCFDFSRIQTYPLSERPNKVTAAELVDPADAAVSDAVRNNAGLRAVVDAIRAARDAGRPVIWFMGAHPIKLGLSPLVIDLMRRGVLTHVAGTGAVAIHDFELAHIGQTSENVPNALPQGRFGMANDTASLINGWLVKGAERGWGFGETVGWGIVGGRIRPRWPMQYPDASMLAAGVRLGIPVTIHVGIGTDIIDQHPSFDGGAKGATSGYDFGVYAASVAKLGEGGVVLNVGSAVTGPEVFLKAVSMAANVGSPPGPITTANFDLRPVVPEDAADETRPTYYRRDHKSVVKRIPAAFGGRGHYVRGDFRETLPALYRMVVG